MEENAMYKVLTKSAKGSPSDKLLCSICNITCLRSNFTTHKNNKKHLENLQSKLGIPNNEDWKGMLSVKKMYAKANLVNEPQHDDEIVEKSESETESEDNYEITMDDCSTKTLTIMKINRNTLISKQPKYWNEIEKHDYFVIDKILTKQSVPLSKFQQTYDRLNK